LKYAVKDARAIETFLRSQGFEVKSLYNQQATREKIVGYLENELAQIMGKSDRFVFFFAGHGHTEIFSGGNERGYVVPFDGKDRSSTYLAMSTIRDISDILSAARHQLFIMDCCYGGTLGSRGDQVHVDPRMPDYLEEVVKRKARQILTAGGATQKVLDVGPEGHSVFTGALLRALNDGFGDTNGDGYISFYELSAYMQCAATRPNQTPGVDFLSGHEQGEFIFRNPTKVPAPVARGNVAVGPTTGPMRGNSDHLTIKEAKQKFLGGDNAGAKGLFGEAAALGNVEAMFFLGLILCNEGDRTRGLQLIRDAADRGYVDAMRSLLNYYKKPGSTNPAEIKRLEREIADAEMFAAKAKLIDPTGGEASRGDPVVPPGKLVIPSPPFNLRVIQ